MAETLDVPSHEPTLVPEAPPTAAEAPSEGMARLLEIAARNADELVAEATAEAEQLTADARAEAEQLTADARAEAERLTAEATAEAEQLTAAARGEADEVLQAARTESARLKAESDALRRDEEKHVDGVRTHLTELLARLDETPPRA